MIHYGKFTKPSLNEIKGEVLLDDTEENVLKTLFLFSFFIHHGSWTPQKPFLPRLYSVFLFGFFHHLFCTEQIPALPCTSADLGLEFYLK